MIEYFFEQTSIEEIFTIKKLLNEKKQKLEISNFDEPFLEYTQAAPLFDEVKRKAIKNENEKLANAAFVAKLYFHLFGNLASYFSLLQNKKYKQSWDKLQDCLDDIYGIGKFVEIDKRMELPILNKLLREYERLYPYSVFVSSEYVITKSECGICGKPMNSFECPHIKGNLYWGEIAYENILEIKEVNAVALVSNPEDKRCIIELSDDDRTETEKFTMLDEFLKQDVYSFQLFTVKDNKVFKRNNTIKKQGANELCICGSGKKFKYCCKSKMYYEHHNYKIHLEDKVSFCLL